MYKLFRRGSGRMLILCVVILSLLVCLYYVSQIQAPSTGQAPALLAAPVGVRYEQRSPLTTLVPDYSEQPDARVSTSNCPLTQPRNADIDTLTEFAKFDFQPSWMRSREYWDDSFEARYAELRKDPTRPPLKVILMPHSHTDPGWLKTFEQYFHSSTRGILNNMVTKLQQWPNMTFIWSEVSFLSLWWESAHPTKKAVVKRLVKEGRLEMTTGGWVMTDEATSHIYAMLDQLIEGHQWLKSNLGVSPQSGWSVDPFGHGGALPYLLKASGVSGTIIQRIHYAWKQWFAKKQYGDFIWLQPWDQIGAYDMLTHNQPFDIYNIKHSCGPHPHVCLNFDFRKIRGEYTEYSVRAVDITPNNVKQMAELLLEQYSRTGSLFSHNVVLMPLGDDFRYDHPIEWDQQYTNYKILVDYINSRKDEYNAEIIFGTPKDYFREIEKRMQKFPTLKGDFFVYSDIFSEGRPAYWSGYFTTRPYMKILDRELEANLRSAEILYTVALNVARQSGNDIKLYETYFEKLVKARRNLGLFQHHDAITGTSKSFVMKDYALKLFESISDMTNVQSFAIQSLTATTSKSNIIYVLPESDRDSFEKLPKKIPIIINGRESKKVILFNPLAQPRQEVVSIKVNSHKVRVLDPSKNPVPYQIAPVMNATSITHDVYVLLFVVDLKPLAIATYHVEPIDKVPTESLSTVYCNRCGKDNIFPIKSMPSSDIQLENHRMKLLIDGQTGLLKRVTKKSTGKVTQCTIQFAAYASAQFHSGAYLFMPDPNLRDTDKDILEAYTPHQKIYIISSSLSSRLTVEYGKLLTHHITIFHHDGPLAEAIHIRNVVDFETPPKNRETEMFMRIQTDLVNGDPPEFYTDVNGHQMLKRTKIERIGIEGNYYPITTMAYIEDSTQRLTLLVNHAQGAASYQPGWLEVMLERRTLYDDSRGMGEGLLDNRKTVLKYWLLLEDITGDKDEYSKPSLFANHISNFLNYPINIFIVDKTESDVIIKSEVQLISKSLPCDLHLLNLRTNHDQKLPHFPVSSALMVLHRQGYSCSVGADITLKHCPLSDKPHPATNFYKLNRANITRMSLTGTFVKKYLKDGFKSINPMPMEIETYNVHFLQ
ncbi:alpha-mannosidase 2 [Microplitis demolitor]|uniref:alpha-mannosidase 2 n=1 Tax=Microplitis demolitor TaxID=69319 RepID=UPI0004CCA7B7|nr:alpha-mannosidase 2 [Microplitis demolitor]XP_008550660.1 alpha-mannosidase 2 [Microplitis demolitor]XP_008550661.1 alpha-mannosidase 2 [Microplitis demolitor]XP_053595603.1 alpha-mannosidase 2 [Microplitis demolitor]XP_053595605.1 alpha-mannosidase 2 [Microplitis demolitor]XP_053595611.1 alpha-mannosidase 2 [Microplitis demolitor]